jgi:uncharacterized protein YbbC (DUF1343 family)
MHVKTGLDIIEKRWPKKLIGSRVGLLAHPASVNRNLEHAISIFLNSKKFTLKAFFGPQHGIHGETQDNMVEWKGFRDKKTGLPVYSLYSTTRKPEPAMLKGIDVLAVDMQDVGSRYYTFIWTLELCMQACAGAGTSIIVLDRPNPLGGIRTEGPVLDMDYSSFVGLGPLPVRHGMTIGEIGNYLKNEFLQSLDFHVLPMQGWKRRMLFDKTGLPWVMPSPNMPTLDSALVYPGMCLFEGTNVSEGRGTTRPFETFGAPFIEPEKLIRSLKKFRLPGVVFRPLYFQPTFQKHANKLCGGAQIHITNRETFKPFLTAVTILKEVHDIYPKHFLWRKPPYEYERKKMPIDILAGTDRIRTEIEKGISLNTMEGWWKEQNQRFNKEVRKKYLIYE